MGCLGFLSLWKNRRKRTPSHGVELHSTTKSPITRSPRRLSEAYVTPENENVVGNGQAPLNALHNYHSGSQKPRHAHLTHSLHGKPNQSDSTHIAVEPTPLRQREHDKPWFKLTDEELRAEYKQCIAKAPKVGPEFLWHQSRDSLEEVSVHAAKGLKPAKPSSHQAKLPLKLCKLAGLCNQLCPHCSDSQPKKHRTISAGRQAYERWRQQNSSNPSETPELAVVTMEAFAEHQDPERETDMASNLRQQDKSEDVEGSESSVTSDEFHWDKLFGHSSESTSSTDKAAQTWWDDFSSSHDPDLNALVNHEPPEFEGWSDIQKYSGEWRFLR
ncbi:hypothetical protein F5Y06DRAFT_36696 [Hypoxylon sp. FL0890]|nr:hypothetical protein F5Y06DRAFT_36696 [Hypoxylon sp. FL0890]